MKRGRRVEKEVEAKSLSGLGKSLMRIEALYI